MPAYIPALRSAGIKWVGGFPENKTLNLPYISGLMILNDVDTGLPYAVMDCTWITAKRTAAASALSAKHLARMDSESVGFLACGVQARTHLEALACVFPLKRVFAYDISAAAQEKFIEEMSEKFPFEFVSVEGPKNAVIDSDLIVTSGPIFKIPQPSIEAGWMKHGAFASAVDFDSYWSVDSLLEIDLLATDDHTQFEYYRSIGYFKQTPKPFADLGELVLGLKKGRQNAEQRTMAMNLGLAIDDMAVAPEIYRKALDLGLGTRLPL